MLSSICPIFYGQSCRYYGEDDGSVEEILEHGHGDQTISCENPELIEHNYVEEESPEDRTMEIILKEPSLERVLLSVQVEKKSAVDSEMAIIPQGPLLEDVLLSVQEEECNPLFSNMDLRVNKALNKCLLDFLYNETNHKIGLYGKNLILEGIKLYDEESQARIKLKNIQEHKNNQNIVTVQCGIDTVQRGEYLTEKYKLEDSLEKIKNKINEDSKLFFKYQKKRRPELDIDSQQIFDSAVAHLENPSAKSSKKLKKTIDKLKEATTITFDAGNFVNFFEKFLDLENSRNQLEVELSKLIEKFGPLQDEYLINCRISNIKYDIERIRFQRNCEKTIYRIFGGKDKFHALKCIDLDPDKTPYRITIASLSKGESVMRGLVCREDISYPFIAISFSESNSNRETQIGVLQEDVDVYINWRFQGFKDLFLLYKYGHLEFIMREGYDRKADLEKALNQLLTTGSCDISPTDPSAGQYKLEQQM